MFGAKSTFWTSERLDVYKILFGVGVPRARRRRVGMSYGHFIVYNTVRSVVSACRQRKAYFEFASARGTVGGAR
jgi:hypothetical protein